MFSIFGITVWPFGLAVSAALVIAFALSLVLAKDSTVRKHIAAIYGFGSALGLIVSRLAWCLVNYNEYAWQGFFASSVRIWEGGASVFAVLIVFILFALAWSRAKRLDTARVLDIITPSIMLFVAVIRWAERFTGQGIGKGVSGSLPSFLTVEAFYETCFNVSLYETVIAAALFVLALILVIAKRANVFEIAFGCLCAFQLPLESMRSDGCMEIHFVKVSFAFAALILFVMLINSEVKCFAAKNRVKTAVTAIVVAVAGAALVVYQEFAVDTSDNLVRDYIIMLCGAMLLYLPVAVMAFARPVREMYALPPKNVSAFTAAAACVLVIALAFAIPALVSSGNYAYMIPYEYTLEGRL